MSDNEKTDIRQKYTNNDIDEMNFRMGVIEGFVDLLDHCDDRGAIPITSIVFILKMLLEPVSDFLSWAATYVEIPEKEAETIRNTP
jgi:hypothetical protein